MVNETKQKPIVTLANPLIRTAQRNRLSEEHVTPMKSIHNIAEEQFPIALKRTSQLHTSGLTLEHATWRPQKPSDVKHDSGYLSRFANRERDHVSRETDKGRARHISDAGGSSTLDITGKGFERPKHSPFIELDDVPRSARSATDALDRRTLLHTASLSNRPVLPETWLPSTPEEDATIPHIFTISRQGSTTSTNSDRVSSAFNTPSSTRPYGVTASAKGRERNRIMTPEQQWSAIYRARDRRQTMPHTHIETSASAPAFERSDQGYPSTPTPPHLVALNLRSVAPAVRYSRSSGSPSSMVPMGYSYSSDSLSSTFPIEHSPSSSQLPPPSASRPITIKKMFSLEDDGFRSSPSPRDWDVPSSSPYETYKFSHSPQTPDELPRSWQSSNFRARHSSQDMRYGLHHVHHYDDNIDDSDLWEHGELRLHQREESFRRREEEIYLREQELQKRENTIWEEEAKRKEDKPRREENDAKRAEDGIMHKELEVVRQGEEEGTGREEDEPEWKEKFAKKEEERPRRKAQGKKRAKDLMRRGEPAAKGSEEEERHVRKSEEAKCQEGEVKLKEQSSPTKEEKIRRKEEELARREEELSRREAEANRRHDQQKVQQEEIRKHVEEIRRQSVEEKTKQGWNSWGYRPRRTTTPPRMSPSRSFPTSTGPLSISNRDERVSTTSPPANRGRSTSISASYSSATWTSSTRLSSTANSWRSNISKPKTPSTQKNQPPQISSPNSNELHMSAAGSSTPDRGRTCTSRSNETWTSSSRLSSNASPHLPSTHNPQISPAFKNVPRQMSASKFSSSSAVWPIIGRNESSATNLPRNHSTLTSTSRSNTPWTFSKLSSITRSQSSSTPKLQTPSPQKNMSPRISSRSASFSTFEQPIPKRSDLHIPATISSTHRGRSKSSSTGRRRTCSTWLIPTESSQSSITSNSQTPSAGQNKKVAQRPVEAGVLKEKEDSQGDQIDWKETLARKEVQEVGKETQVRNTANIVRPEVEKVERHIAHNLLPTSDESGCKEEAKLEAFGAMHVTEEEILKEGKPARGEECNRLTPYWKHATLRAVTPEYFRRNNENNDRGVTRFCVRFPGRSD
ncbi:hypothetical protein CY34DRAFT_255974 [Suillus luteus UH-Slu-Lm8-n1]|uniref:Uncharacterized protein n=1 Tax=Suillus luteus UH-Slu-Lm8-n1 TaxID=930992 RepID=A0A0D0BAR7_9AGAM|nr:hypothetical protein CY34DRAFT_255974 [Suillus luteus UH-Slu-Lm8-n1]